LPVVILLAPGWTEAAPAYAPSMSGARSVAVSTPACKAGSFPAVPFLDSLRVELASGGFACCTLADSTGKAPATDALLVKIELVPCTPDGEMVQVSVRDAASARAIERDFSLADVAQTARPRALALAVAELIRSLGQAASDDTRPAVSAEASHPSPAPSENARPFGLSVRVEGEARALPAHDTWMWGGRVRLTAPWRAFHADLDVGAGYASAHADLGDVQLRSMSVGLAVGPRFENRMAILDLGLHADLGWAWVRGETSSADVRTGSGSDLISSVGLRASLEAPARTQVRPGIAVEGGFVLHGLKGEANGQPVVGISGYYLLAAIGIAVSP
jgi:hypothetical protein